MKLGTLKNGEVVELRGDGAHALNMGSMLELITQGNGAYAHGEARTVSPAELAAPLRNPSKIIAIGLNYVDHVSETKLEPGDIIASGTPSGVGFTRQPPIYLRPGDTLRTWVEGVGELVNPVLAA